MRPLAERMRPKNLDEYIGQKHIVGKEAILRSMIENGSLASLILWGPPGVGKTTLAHIISKELARPCHTLSAVTSGVKEVREVIEKSKQQRFFSEQSPILFIDEIHRFSKSQQDSLLGAVENGTITLIGATTENPSFEVIRPLLSRCQVYTLHPLDADELLTLAHRAFEQDPILQHIKFDIAEEEALIRYAGGDARKLLNIIDLLSKTTHKGSVKITNEKVIACLQENPTAYDKDGEVHYDIISAYIKSIRGSDPDAAIYWLARMIAGGEDPLFVARRLIIAASEDIGLANPNALLMANACFDAVQKIGLPEGRIPLAQATIYLATSPKSNSAYTAINDAIGLVKEKGNLPVPLHLRNAPTQLMQEMGYGKEYKYSHDYEENFVQQAYLPKALTDTKIWHPQANGAEQKLSEQVQRLWKKKN